MAGVTEAIADAGALRTLVNALKDREARLQELRASLDGVEARPNPKLLNVDSLRWEALQQLSEWQGLRAQNVPIVRQILRKVLEGRLVFVPRQEGDERGVTPTHAVASPRRCAPFTAPGRFVLRAAA